jgi:NAD(P)-dependent dehydrogenase (short-subunit alcohol dehydrogenase family)
MSAVLYTVREGIAYVTLNRPEAHNAMDPRMVVELAEAWLRYEADDEARIAIVTGAGERAFSAGADLRRLIPLMTRARALEDRWEDTARKARLNLWSVIYCCRAVLPHMAQRGAGSIVDIGSDAGRMGEYREAVYSACKGGVIALTKALAREAALAVAFLASRRPASSPARPYR